jgi:Na+/melibiose symporter-like transporter
MDEFETEAEVRMYEENTRDIRREAFMQKRDSYYPHVEKTTGEMTIWKKLAYAAPAFSITSLTMLISIHGTLFFTKLGAKVAFLGFFTAIARTFDVITDPLMGYISDNSKLEFGRRRPFMLGGCWFYALFFVLLMSPPDNMDPSGVAAWFGVFYIIFYWADTVSNVPYGALGPELTDDPDERNKVFFFFGIFKGIGILMAAVAPVMFGIYFENNPDKAAFHDVACYCDDDVPSSGFTTSQLARYGDSGSAYNSTYYEYDFLCKASDCMPYDDCISFDNFEDTQCDWIYSTQDDTCLTGFFNWCSDYYDCSNDCAVDAAMEAMSVTALTFALYYIIAMLTCVFLISERRQAVDEETPPLVPAIMTTLRNKPFMGLLPAWVLDMTAFTMLGTMLPFYVTYVVDPGSAPECDNGKRCPSLGYCPNDDCCSPDEEDAAWCGVDYWLGLGLVALMTATIISTPFWLWVTSIVGKNKTWLVFNLFTALTNGLFVFVGQGNPKAVVFLAFLNGLPNGASFLTDSIVADVIDYDEFLTGTRSEGRFTIFQTFIPKIVSIPSQAVPLGLLSAFGFVAPKDGVAQEQPNAVKMFIKFVFFVLPTVFSLASFFVKNKFPIKTEKQMTQVAEGVALHMKGLPALDPLSNRMVSLFPFKDQEEVKLSWGLDCFYVEQLKLLSNKGPNALVSEMKKSLWISGFWGVFFFLLTVASASAGALDTPSVAWIPSLTVIMMGIFLCASFVNWYRVQTATHYTKEPMDQEFLDKWIVFVDGVDYVRNRDEMNRIRRMVSIISQNYSLDEEEVMTLIEECFPDLSDPSGLHKFLEEKKKADESGEDFNWSANTKKYISKVSTSFHGKKSNKQGWTSCFPAICPEDVDEVHNPVENSEGVEMKREDNADGDSTQPLVEKPDESKEV